MSAQSDEAIAWIEGLFKRAEEELATAKHQISQLERGKEEAERELALAHIEIDRLKGERG